MTRSYLYIARRADRSDLIKIGISGAVGVRMYELTRKVGAEVSEVWSRQIGTCSAGAVEYIAHAILRDQRVEGEWFAVDEQTARTVVAGAIRLHRRGDRQKISINPRRVSVATSVLPELRDAIRLHARARDMTVAGLVERILDDWVKGKAKRAR